MIFHNAENSNLKHWDVTYVMPRIRRTASADEARDRRAGENNASAEREMPARVRSAHNFSAAQAAPIDCRHIGGLPQGYKRRQRYRQPLEMCDGAFD